MSRPLVACSHTSSSVPRSSSSAAVSLLNTIQTSPSRELSTAHVSDVTPTPQSDLHAVAPLTEVVSPATPITWPRRIDAAEARVGSSRENSDAIPTLARATPSPVPSSHGLDGTAGSEHSSPLPPAQHSSTWPASDLEPAADATVAVTADLVVTNHVGPTRDNAESLSLGHSRIFFPLGSSNQLLQPSPAAETAVHRPRAASPARPHSSALAHVASQPGKRTHHVHTAVARPHARPTSIAEPRTSPDHVPAVRLASDRDPPDSDVFQKDYSLKSPPTSEQILASTIHFPLGNDYQLANDSVSLSRRALSQRDLRSIRRAARARASRQLPPPNLRSTPSYYLWFNY